MRASRSNTDRPGSFSLTRRSVGIALLNLIASVHIVWFYLAYVPSELNLPRYEQGLERIPFQHRLLMSFPLRWAHGSPWINHVADRLTAMPAWFPHGVHPEGVVEAVIDLVCVLITGLIARSLYQAASPRKLLTPYVYPLTLLMITGTFCLNTMHRIRFVFDFPSMAFFAIGSWLIYFRRSPLLLAAVFCIGTVNRETTLFLLILFLITRLVDSPNRRKALDLQSILILLSLSTFWIVWRHFIFHRFAANPTASGPRLLLNIGTLLWPTSWAQLFCTFAFCWPLCLAGRRLVRDPTLRAWYWVLPVWFLFMMRYGILIETRIFGELIPLLACTAALIAEAHVVHRLAGNELSEPQCAALRSTP